jgi:hypothetical protein
MARIHFRVEEEILAFEDVVSSFKKANDQSQKELDKFQGWIENHIYLLEDIETKFQKLCSALDTHNLKVHDVHFYNIFGKASGVEFLPTTFLELEVL